MYFMIMYLCMKYESNTPMFSKDIARKPFFVRTGQDVRMYVRTRVMLYAPPHYKWRGHKKRGRGPLGDATYTYQGSSLCGFRQDVFMCSLYKTM